MDRSRNAYLHAQSGLFTWLQADLFFAEHGRWPSLEEVAKASVTTDDGPPVLRKINLPKHKAKKLLQILDREGVNDAALRPSFDNVAATTKARWAAR